MKKHTLGFVLLLSILIIPVTFAAKIFSDVGRNDWFAEYVGEIKNWGIINGNDDGTFAPERGINRAEFSKMIYLYDQRVDEKVNNVLPPAIVMYLEKYNEIPASCPSGWREAGYGKNWMDSGKNSYKRTCYTTSNCTVMYLEAFNEEPSTCPNNWREADYGTKWKEDGKNKYLRTCYICAN